MMSHRIRIYLDCDGVLADFAGSYERLTGQRPSLVRDNVDWSIIPEGFYRDLDPLPWASDLVTACHELGVHPTVLTGLPRSIPTAADEKTEWVRHHLPGTPIITCRSRDKRDYGGPGAILVDDWTKHRDRWVDAGGVFIHFQTDDGWSALDRTIQELICLCLSDCPECSRPVISSGRCEECNQSGCRTGETIQS